MVWRSVRSRMLSRRVSSMMRSISAGFRERYAPLFRLNRLPMLRPLVGGARKLSSCARAYFLRRCAMISLLPLRSILRAFSLSCSFARSSISPFVRLSSSATRVRRISFSFCSFCSLVIWKALAPCVLLLLLLLDDGSPAVWWSRWSGRSSRFSACVPFPLSPCAAASSSSSMSSSVNWKCSWLSIACANRRWHSRSALFLRSLSVLSSAFISFSSCLALRSLMAFSILSSSSSRRS
mmetsp:Transcript_23603/g.67808  ORF Transcript_23603/g.67808 Transcript_23603/m.67808 type:complete len:237 (+) Transcript_23603:298-1008(+)